MLLLLVLTLLLAHEAKGLENQVDSHAKLQNLPSNQEPQPEVIGVKAETRCSFEGVRIFQGQIGYLPDGTPLLSVDIINECESGCVIHLSCASFRSERVINPKVLRLIAPGDCLLNDGKPLLRGETISFQYASATQYPFTVKYLTCGDNIVLIHT